MKTVIATLVMSLLLIGTSGSMVLAAGCCGGWSSTGSWPAYLPQAVAGQYSGGSLPSCCSAGAYVPDAGRLRAPNNQALPPCCQPTASGQVSKSAEVRGPVKMPVVRTAYAGSGQISAPGFPETSAKAPERASLPSCCAATNTPLGAMLRPTKDAGNAPSLWALLGAPMSKERSITAGTAPQPSGIAITAANVRSLPATWSRPAATGQPYQQRVGASNGIGLPPCCAGPTMKR